MTRLVPFLIASVLFHGLILGSSLPWMNRSSSPGHSDAFEENLFVEVVAEQERTAAALTPSAIDAAASAESQPTKESTQPQESPQEERPVEEEPKTEIVPGEDDPSPSVVARETAEPKTDFIDSDEEAPESQDKPAQQYQDQEVIEKKEPEDEADNSTKEDKKIEETQKETPESKTSIAQIASRQSVFRGSRGHDLADFKAKVIAAIKKASYYPRKAARKKDRGVVLVRFILWKDGRVDDIEISRSSGSKLLDEAAVETMRKATKDFPKFPQSLQADHLIYAVPIVFKGKGESKTRN
jgi:protein TonB